MPNICEYYQLFVFTINILAYSLYYKSDSGTLRSIHNLQLLQFADVYVTIDYQVIDRKIVHLQKQVQMPTAYSEHKW